MKNHYFQNLNYTLGNEDTRLEFDVLSEGLSHVLAVCGSGGRVLPLLARSPARITAVDVSPLQLSLLKLRVALLKEGSVEDFLRFWAYPSKHESMGATERKRKFSNLSIDHSVVKDLTPIFEANRWDSLLLAGRWERTFIKLSGVVRRILGEEWVERFFSVENLDDHRAFMRTEFPKLRWRLVLALVSNSTVFNVLLYRGNFPRKNIPQSYLQFYIDAFDRIFAQGPARENYFLQLCFLGRLRHASGLPAEAQPEILRKMKENIDRVEWEFVQGDVVEAIAGAKTPVDFVSLSDVPSYFRPPTESSFLATIRPGLSSTGVVVIRNYLHVPERLVTDGYREITARYSDSISREYLQVYDAHVYEKSEEKP